MIWPAFIAPGSAFRHSVFPALLGLALPLAAILLLQGPVVLPRIVLLLIVTLFWQALFCRVRGRAMEPSGIVTALLVAILVPADAPFWQLALGMTFGIVIGEQIFGGRGRNFVHPAVVVLAFVMFSFTDATYRAGPDIPVWTLLPALVLLLVTGQAARRILLGFAIAMPLVLWAVGGEPAAPFLSGAIVFAVLYLAADPVASASTNPGRVIHGLLVGTLAALFSQAGELFGSVVFAILMASIFAPTIDQIIIALHIRRRAARHG
ncbi:RnfABCDGE type electron transport complex subunit D [Aliihoeflea sp. PC F10.4]